MLLSSCAYWPHSSSIQGRVLARPSKADTAALVPHCGGSKGGRSAGASQADQLGVPGKSTEPDTRLVMYQSLLN